MYSLFKSFEREPLQPVQKSQLKDKTNPKVKIIMMLKLTFLLKKKLNVLRTVTEPLWEAMESCLHVFLTAYKHQGNDVFSLAGKYRK